MVSGHYLVSRVASPKERRAFNTEKIPSFSNADRSSEPCQVLFQGFHPTLAVSDSLTEMPLAKPLLGLQALRYEGIATLEQMLSPLNADSPPAGGGCQVSIGT